MTERSDVPPQWPVQQPNRFHPQPAPGGFTEIEYVDSDTPTMPSIPVAPVPMSANANTGIANPYQNATPPQSQERVVRYVPQWGIPPVIKVERRYSTGEKVGCGTIAAGLLALALVAYFCHDQIGEGFARFFGQYPIPTPTAQPQCGPGIDGGGNTTSSGLNDGTFNITGNGGATMVDVTTHDGAVFNVNVVVLQPGQTATVQHVYGDHVWKYGSACTVDDVSTQVPDHTNRLNQIPNTNAHSISEDDLQKKGILSITNSSTPQSSQEYSQRLSQFVPDARAQFADVAYRQLGQWRRNQRG